MKRNGVLATGEGRVASSMMKALTYVERGVFELRDKWKPEALTVVTVMKYCG